MTKVKFNLDDDLAILLQAYQDQSGTDRDAIINQAVKQLLVKKIGKKRIAQLLKDSIPYCSPTLKLSSKKPISAWPVYKSKPKALSILIW